MMSRHSIGCRKRMIHGFAPICSGTHCFGFDQRVCRISPSRTTSKNGWRSSDPAERLEYDDAEGVRKASIAAKKGEGRGGLAYFGHSDVVPAANWHSREHGPFQPTVRDGKLFGRGACDMKGSLACSCPRPPASRPASCGGRSTTCARRTRKSATAGQSRVAERSSLYQEMAAGESCGVIGEPTSLDVVYAHKGGCVFRATSHGVAAHSSTRKGVNANLAMIPFLTEMKQIYEESETDPAWRRDEFEPPTICWNIGINDFTTAINITPPQSVCTVCFRPMPGQGKVLIGRRSGGGPACGVEFEVIIRGEPLYVDPRSAYVQKMVELAGQGRLRTVAYGTDGSIFTAMKKLVVLGPGDIAQAHTNDEWIAFGRLGQAPAFYRRLINHWCC